MSLVYALLALTALAVGLCARDRSVRLMTCLFAANWLFCVASYSSTPPVAVLWSMGLMLKSEEAWAVLDLVCAASAFSLSMGQRWGVALWALYTFQCCFHVVSAVGLIEDGAYSDALDGVFVVQAFVFLLMGGGDARDRLFDWMRFLRRLGGAPSRALRKAATW